VKEGIRSFAIISAAFGRVGRIQMGNPGPILFQARLAAKAGLPLKLARHHQRFDEGAS
jgi:hypothetical protein